MMNFFDVNNIAFELLDYKMSWLELIATVAGLLAVWLSARQHIANWGIGLINVTCSAVIFYKMSLYSDVFLQIYFFVTGLYGWYLWAKRKEDTREPVVKISWLTHKQRVLMLILIVFVTLFWGYLMAEAHSWLPSVFPTEAAFPYADTLVMVMSIFGNLLLMVKKIESWILWVLVDIIAPVLYFQKGILLITFEYVIFLGLASFALVNWLKVYRATKNP